MQLIAKVFPNIETLKTTINSNTNPEDYFVPSMKMFKKLKSLQLTITDGCTYFNGWIPKLNELKLYFQLTCYNEFILKNLLSKFSDLKSLTICEGLFSLGSVKALESEKIIRLSIKNPLIDDFELERFEKKLYSLDLKILKLIVTHIPNPSAYYSALNLIYRYLTNLPHTNIQELSISMPNDEMRIDYLEIVNKLPKLKKLRLFVSCTEFSNNIQKLTTFFDSVRKNLDLTLVFCKFQSQDPITKNELKIFQNHKNIKIIKRKYPYITYVQKIDSRLQSITRYKKMERLIMNRNPSSNESKSESEEVEETEETEDRNSPSTIENITNEDFKEFLSEIKKIDDDILKNLENSLLTNTETINFYHST